MKPQTHITPSKNDDTRQTSREVTPEVTLEVTLEVSGATLKHKNHTLFQNLSLQVKPGQTLTLMGPSGSGKSSLLHWICGTLSPELTAQGNVKLNGQSILELPTELRQLGILFQDDLLLPHLNIAANLAFGLKRPPNLKPKQWKSFRTQNINEALREAELESHALAFPHQLSSGQRVRIALMRTLLCEPRALLLDEPFSKLDAALKDRIRHFVFQHATARSLPILLVTHDTDDARVAKGDILMLESFIPKSQS
ncbi:MAG: ATP-binding cassette domain-containing protein [Alphaproteobacteria bacterium]